MPNNVETKIWLIKSDGSPISEKQVEEFFSQFIGINPKALVNDEPRRFDFNSLVPQPDNIWLGYIGGEADENLEVIEELGGLDAVRQDIKSGKRFPHRYPCLNDEQIVGFGLVNGLDWNNENWETKWGAYDCRFDWSARYGGPGDFQVLFYTAWCVPEKILRMVRNIALEQGFEIECEFGGELDEPGIYTNGTFMYWNTEWNEEKEEFERVGDPIDVHT
jgi:hypothetical protein